MSEQLKQEHRPDAVPSESPASRSRPERALGRTAPAWIAAIVVPVVVVGGVFLSPFVRDRTRLPYGADTLNYVTLEALVHTDGVEALTPERSGSNRTLGDRAGYFVDVSLLLTLTRTDPLTLAWVSPALFAVCVALAVVYLVGDGLRLGPGWGALAGIGVGASAWIAWTAVGYATNLAVDSLLLITAALAVGVVFDGWRRIGGPALVLAGAFLVHWMFTALLVIVLVAGVVGAALVWRFAPRLTAIPRRGLGRLLISIAAGLIGAVLLFLVAPDGPHRGPVYGDRHVLVRMGQRMPSFHLSVTAPLALAAALLLIATAWSRRVYGAVQLAAWALVAPSAYLAWRAFRIALPPYRSAAFAVAIPLLVVLLGAAVAFAPFLRPAWLRVGAGALVAGGLAAAFVAGGSTIWSQQQTHFDRSLIAQVRTVDAYLREASVPNATPIRFSIGQSATIRREKTVRKWILPGMSPERYGAVQIVTLDPQPDAGPNDPGAPDGALPAARPGEPVIVSLSTIEPELMRGVHLARGIVVVSGPRPPRMFTPAVVPTAPDPMRLAALLGWCLLALALAGVGWAWSFGGVRGWLMLPAAPGFGVAVLAAIGLVASRLGVAFSGTSGVLIVVLAGVSGWVPLAVARLRDRRIRGATADAWGTRSAATRSGGPRFAVVPTATPPSRPPSSPRRSRHRRDRTGTGRGARPRRPSG
jgi:hypothetical protein